jgi:hypothetical protein
MTFQFPPPLAEFYKTHSGAYPACLICGDGLSSECFYHEVGFCYDCAKSVAALFFYQHSGEYGGLYPMPPRPQRIRRNKSGVSDSRRMRIYRRDNFTCQHCGSKEDISIDHILAVSNGGTHDDDNLQVLCRPCNSRKGAR